MHASLELTPLHIACQNGDLDAVQTLIKAGDDPKSESEDKTTPLHLACRFGHLEIAQELIKAGADPNAKSNFLGKTPLHWACQNRHFEIAQALIVNGANNFNEKDYRGMSPIDHFLQNDNPGFRNLNNSLIYNSKNGNVKKVKLLLLFGADATHVTTLSEPSGSQALHIVCQMGHLEVAQELIKFGADLNAKGPRKFTPLHLACQNGHLELAKALIEAGADPKSESEDKTTPLHLACKNGHLEIVQKLIKAGADPKSKSENKTTPLHYACQNGHLEIAQELIKAGADLNAKGPHDTTPLHLACQNSHLEIAQELIKAGADIYAQNSQNKSPIDIVLMNETANFRGEERSLNNALLVNSMRGNVAKVKLLLALGANVNHTRPSDPLKSTALSLACTNNNLDLVNILLGAGADPNIHYPNRDATLRDSPLHIACRQNNLNIVQTLLDKGANPNVGCRNHQIVTTSPDGSNGIYASDNGIEPLHIACFNGNLEIVTALLKKGAKINNKDNNNDLPFDIAFKNNNQELCLLLSQFYIEKGIEFPPSIIASARAFQSNIAQGSTQLNISQL